MPDAISGYTCQELIVEAIRPVGWKASNYSGDDLTRLNFLFNTVYLKFCNFYPWRWKNITSDFTFASGSRIHNFNTDSIFYKQIYTIFITQSGYEREVEPKQYSIVKGSDITEQNTGVPNYYAEYGGKGKIYLDATPDQNLTAEIAYEFIPQIVTDFDQYTLLPREAQHVLKDLLAYEIAKDKKDVSMNDLKKAAEESLQALLFNEQAVDNVGDFMYGEGDIYDPGAQPTVYDYLKAWFR